MVKAVIFLTKLVIVAFVAILFTSCRNGEFVINGMGNGIKGSGNIVTNERTITEDFKSINVSQGIEVTVEQSENKSVKVEADDNIQAHIITKVVDGVLIVETDHGYNTEKAPKVIVKMPVISGLSTTSGSFIKSVNTLISNNMVVKSESGSGININVEADDISLETSSGSNIHAGGKALRLETSSSSGSELDAEKLMANEVVSQSSSGSSTSISPIVKLEAKASSGSSIGYHKIPKSISKEENSGGSVSEQ